MKRLNPLNDYLFQKIMGEQGDEEQLLSLLNAILPRTGKHLKGVRILENKTLTADIIGDKTSILDIRAVADTGAKVDMEVQLRDLHNTNKRSLYYWSNDYRRGIVRGEDYIHLPNVIAINIVDFSHIGLDSFHTSFHIYEDRHKDYMLTDALEIHFIDMTVFKRLKTKDLEDPLHRWLLFLDEQTKSEIIEEVLRMDHGIQKAQEKLDLVSIDWEALRYYEMRAMALADYNTSLQTAQESGLKRGLEEGLKKGRLEGRLEGEKHGAQKRNLEIARNFKALGIPLEQIILGTGLLPEEIEKL